MQLKEYWRTIFWIDIYISFYKTTLYSSVNYEEDISFFFKKIVAYISKIGPPTSSINGLFRSFLRNEGEGFGGVSTTSNPSFLIPPNWRDLEGE